MRNSGSTNSGANAKVDFGAFTVSKAKEVKEGRARFNLTINGITIYGMWLSEYTNSKGEEKTAISFPQYKGSDGKYYDVCWAPFSAELKDKITKAVYDELKKT